MKMHAVAVLPHEIGSTQGWCIIFQNGEDADGDGMPDFHHFLIPAHSFAVMAEEFGLDVEEDFDEMVELVLFDLMAGREVPEDNDDISRPMRHNRLGRRFRRRADRAKRQHEISGMNLVREKLKNEKTTGLKEYKDRMSKVQAARERSRRQAYRPVDLLLPKEGR